MGHINHCDWSIMLGKIEYGLNNTLHLTTKVSPSKLLFGVEQRCEEIDELTEYLEEKLDVNSNVIWMRFGHLHLMQ